MNCPERVIARIANMMTKLNIKDFGEEFEDTVYVKEVEVNADKMITCVYFMRNGGN